MKSVSVEGIGDGFGEREDRATLLEEDIFREEKFERKFIFVPH